MEMTETAPDKEGRIHPCNGYILVAPTSETEVNLIVVRDPDAQHFQSAIVIELSDDETEDFPVVEWEWQAGDLIYFKECTQIENHMFVHWTDVYAYKRFASENPGA